MVIEDAELPRGLEQVLSAGLAPNLHGLVLLRQGQVVLEQYGVGRDYAWGKDLGLVAFERQTLHGVRSVTKSITLLD